MPTPRPLRCGDPVASPTLIPLHGESNFRDLGGYPTASGRRTRFGQVFRSGRLSRLTDRDVETLADLGIRTVVSLLTEDDEAEYGPDRLPPGASLVRLPIDGAAVRALADEARRALATGDFTALPPSTNAEIHRILVAEGAAQYGQLLRLLSDHEVRPLVFHCSHGVHRTGTAAAILLSLLGVPWRTVRDDYLASNDVRAAVVQRRLEQLRAAAAAGRGIDPASVDMANVTAFLVQQGSYIDASRDAVAARYGSFDDYASTALGLDGDAIASLRRSLLE
jgi:protein-tyrosine phosphatase